MAPIKSGAGTHSTRANTPQWDSLKHIEVVFAIEDELQLQFDEEHLASLDSVTGRLVGVSLATAKAYWEEIKPTLTPAEQADHPARFAMVELENIHDAHTADKN